MNREELKQVLDNNEYVVLKFGAEWCGPCKQIAPVLEQLADEYQDRIKYVSIDVEESTEITAEYKIRNVPTIIFIKKSEIQDKAVGSISRNTLVEKIEKLISE